ncbi:alpha/beta fold hydrolase [Novosphingobium guangzhouense]|uniref:Alpha/beta hydrolase n=1 Tax=Novosphingobium guangzhouense TaxID=1850347 RepID=A0A2K2FUR8_9SPHN|nr:alpha/beta hydrolase [Novosphingobium guangzhouense]PNU02539.1 alpha/beta hydrolase [Novosphingobium guangzhouense]
MDYRVHHYRSADGRLDLVARDYPAAAGKPVLLLMHGLTRNSADFEPLVNRLAGTYRILVPDQRGRGMSQWDPDATQYRPDVYALDMLALLDGLGIARAALVGTSMGGLIAMVMHALRPELVQAVVFNDIGPVLDPAGLRRIQGYVGPAGAMTDWAEAAARTRAINAPAFPDYGQAQWDAFARRLACENADGTVSFAYDPAISQSISGDDPQTVPPDLWPLWDLLDAVPVLAVRGALSDLLSVQTVQDMAHRHSGFYATAEVPRVGHAPLLDEPVALAAVKTFLEEHVR